MLYCFVFAPYNPPLCSNLSTASLAPRLCRCVVLARRFSPPLSASSPLFSLFSKNRQNLNPSFQSLPHSSKKSVPTSLFQSITSALFSKTPGGASNPIRNAPFHPLEKEQPTQNHQRNRSRRRQQQRPRRLPVPRQRPPKPVNHPGHGIQPV